MQELNEEFISDQKFEYNQSFDLFIYKNNSENFE